MTHRPHPIEDDPEDALLYDDCERCRSQAIALTSLDRYKLSAILNRMIEVELEGTARYRTANEARAGAEMYRIYVLMGRLGRQEIESILERF